MSVVVCHTPGCANEDAAIPLELTYTDEDGEPQTVEAVACGVCGQPITDIT